MSERNDGGPAFPVSSYVNADGETHESKPQGMSLRDAMALSVRMPDEYAPSWAEVLVGEKAPMPVDGKAAPIDFWMRAEAAYRYRMADAMLKAREA